VWEYGPGPRATGVIWSRRTVAGSGPEISRGGADVGLRCAGYAAPSVWSTKGTLRPCSRSLISGPVRMGDLGCFIRPWFAAWGLHSGVGGFRLGRLPCPDRRVVWVACPDQAPETQVPKPPRCTTRAANRFSLIFLNHIDHKIA
jgi:hypothetical protein